MDDSRVNGDGPDESGALTDDSGDESAVADGEGAAVDAGTTFGAGTNDGAARPDDDAGPGRNGGLNPAGDGADSSDLGDGSAESALPEGTDGRVTRQNARSIREYLRRGEGLDRLVRGTVLGDSLRGAGTLGVTGDRLLVVTDDGEFAGIGLDRICSVRGHTQTSLGVRGNDYRLLLAAGYLLAVVGFVGVLGLGSSALAPMLTLATLGGVMAVDYVRREDVSVDATELTDAAATRGDLPAGLAGRLRRVGRELDEWAGDGQLALGGAGTLAVVPFLAILAVDASILTPVFALLTVGSVWLIVYAFRNSEAFDGLELVRRQDRTITVGLEDGSSLRVQTDPDAGLDGELARRIGTGSPTGRRDVVTAASTS